MISINDIINSPELREVGRMAVEDELVEWRDERRSMLNRGNGLVIREADGSESSIIRFGMEMALKIALQAILDSSRSLVGDFRSEHSAEG